MTKEKRYMKSDIVKWCFSIVWIWLSFFLYHWLNIKLTDWYTLPYMITAIVVWITALVIIDYNK